MKSKHRKNPLGMEALVGYTGRIAAVPLERMKIPVKIAST
jgi:hypothetical protein